MGEREKFWIGHYNSFENGYNLNEGGYGGGPKVWSEESRKKKSLSQKGKIPNEKARENMSKAQKGRKLPAHVIEMLRRINTGKVYSEESLEKMREAKRGKKLTEETKAKIGRAGLGRKHSPETIEKMRQSRVKYAEGARLKREERDIELFRTVKFIASVPNHNLIEILREIRYHGKY